MLGKLGDQIQSFPKGTSGIGVFYGTMCVKNVDSGLRHSRPLFLAFMYNLQNNKLRFDIKMLLSGFELGLSVSKASALPTVHSESLLGIKFSCSFSKFHPI